MKKFIYLFIMLVLVGITPKIHAQTCIGNPASRDQFPTIIDLQVVQDPTAPIGSALLCKGKLKVTFVLNDNNNMSNPMPAWIMASTTLVATPAAAGSATVGGNFINIGPATPGGPDRYYAELSLSGIDMSTATSLQVILDLMNMDPTWGFNPDWDWAYDDPINCGAIYMGGNMVDFNTPIFYASDDDNVSVPNTFIPQMIFSVNNINVTPIVNGLGTTHCTATNVNGFFNLTHYTGNPTDVYHYDVNIYEVVGGTHTLIQTITGLGNPAVVCPPPTCVNGWRIPFNFTFNMAIDRTYSFSISNIKVTTNTGNLVTGFNCWEWQNTAPAPKQYGPHATLHETAKYTIGSKPLPAGCAPLTLFSSAPSTVFNFDHSSYTGTAANPVVICDKATPVEITKPLDAITCYGNSVYKLEVQEFDQSFSTTIGSRLIYHNIFAGNTATNYNGSNIHNLNSTNFCSGFFNALGSTARSFTIRIVGHQPNCPDITEDVFYTLFFRYSPSPATVPKVTIRVNGLGNGRGLNTACCQTPLVINGGSGENTISVHTSAPLHTSTIRARVLRSDTSYYKCPDTSAAGVLWSNMRNAPCFPPYSIDPTGPSYFSFCTLGGNNFGFGNTPLPAGCPAGSGANCPENQADLYSFLYGRGGSLAATCSYPSPCGITPEQVAMSPEHFYKNGSHEAHVYLEVWTEDKCSGLASERAYLKLRVLPPVRANQLVLSGCGIVVPSNPQIGIKVDINDINDLIPTKNVLVGGPGDHSLRSTRFLSGSPLSTNPCYNPGYNTANPSILDPNQNSGYIYAMGKQTGLFAIRYGELPPDDNAEFNVDNVRLRISRVKFDQSQAACGWQYVFNPNGHWINILNRRSGLTGLRPANIKLPVNNPYGDYMYTSGGLPSNGDLFVNGGHPDMFKSPAHNAPIYIYKVEMDIVNSQNYMPLIPNPTMVGNYVVGFFRFRSGTLDDRGGDAVVEPEVIALSPEGRADFALAQHQLRIETSLPEGGQLEYSLFDLGGRRIYHQPQQAYPQGIYTEKVDLKNLAPGAYILRYRLAGKDYDIKLGTVNW